MRLPSWRWSFRAGAAGGVLALLLLAALNYSARLDSLDLYGRVHAVIAVLWPSSILLLGTAGQERTLTGYVILALAILGNVLLYGLAGAILSMFGAGARFVSGRTSRNTHRSIS
jgi:hypothetical protein